MVYLNNGTLPAVTAISTRTWMYFKNIGLRERGFTQKNTMIWLHLYEVAEQAKPTNSGKK